MAAVKSKALTSRISASVNKRELEQFRELCLREGRTQRAQIMFMTRRRMMELKCEAGDAR